jgi:hypothetical protein
MAKSIISANDSGAIFREAHRELTPEERQEHQAQGWRGEPCEDPEHCGTLMGRCSECGKRVAPEIEHLASAAPHIGPIAEYDPEKYSDLPWKRQANQPEEPPPDNVLPLPWLQYLMSLEDHDWTQHGLGDDEHWGRAHPHRDIEGALDSTGQHQFPGLNQLQPTGEHTGSTHAGTEVHVHPSTGERWLAKFTPDIANGGAFNAPFMAAADQAASALQQTSGLVTPPTFLDHGIPEGGTKDVPASAQLMFDAKNAFPSKKPDPEKLSDPDLMTLQKHHALDWLIGNHDSHGNQFIRDQTGQLIGIDKGQAFKHYGQDKLDWNYHPNSVYSETEPVYNGLYRNMARGGRILNDPRQGDLGQFIQGLQDIPDDEFADTLRPYAEQAAAAGSLAKNFTNYSGHAPQRFPSNDSDAFLHYAIERKNALMHDFGDLYDKAMAHRMMGMKIARVARIAEVPASITLLAMAMPNPDEMIELPHEPGEAGSHGSKFYRDPQGRWIVKVPNPGNEFLTPLDKATADLQAMSGLETPETYAMPWQGGMATAIKLYKGPHGEPIAPERWSPPPGQEHNKNWSPRLSQMTPQEQLVLQKHHALDWLIANHDAHIGNWLDTDHGLVGIDKGQAMKYFGQDDLDYKFHPNYYAKPPVYNRLWKDFAKGRPGEMLDPREGELGEFVKGLQDIPDLKLRQMFAPYAFAAANAGMLGTGKYGHSQFMHYQADPNRGLHPPNFHPNDPGQFLDALVDRKNHLADDLGAYYDKNAVEREFNLAHPPPPRPPKPKYQPPPWAGGYGGGGGMFYDPFGQSHWAPPKKPQQQKKPYQQKKPWFTKKSPQGGPPPGAQGPPPKKQRPFGKPPKSIQQQMSEAEDAWDWET